jgi:hypothetical protein
LSTVVEVPSEASSENVAILAIVPASYNHHAVFRIVFYPLSAV